MFSLPFLPSGKHTLSDAQKRTLLKFACAIAWADGKVVDAEREALTTSLRELGGIHRSEFEAMLHSTRSFDDSLRSEIASLPPADAHKVLKLAFRIASADGHIDDTELAVIQQASEVLFPDKPWELVLDWIRSYHLFLTASRRLFGTRPQLPGREPGLLPEKTT
jgi:tellurite resistance protein